MSLPDETLPSRPALPRLLVVALALTGLLTVGGLGLVVYGFAAGMSTAPAGEPYERRIDLPAGATMVRSLAVGDRLAIELRLANGGSEILVLDPRDGAILGRIVTAGR